MDGRKERKAESSWLADWSDCSTLAWSSRRLAKVRTGPRSLKTSAFNLLAAQHHKGEDKRRWIFIFETECSMVETGYSLEPDLTKRERERGAWLEVSVCSGGATFLCLSCQVPLLLLLTSSSLLLFHHRRGK